MRIVHPRVDNIARVCEGARRAAQLAPNESQGWLGLFALSHSGKSHAIKMYLERVVVPELIASGAFPKEMPAEEIARKQSRVIHVTLNEKATRESLYVDILLRLGCSVKASAKIGTLRRQLYQFLRGENDPINNPNKKRPCDLLIIDEIQHLSQGVLKQIKGSNTKSFEATGTDVTDALKFMMIEGMVPLMFVGVPESRVHLSVDPQLRNRHIEAIDFSPLRWSSDSDAEMFTNYVGKIGIMINRHGLLPKVCDLLDHDIPHRLWASSGGLMGLASRIAEMAVYHALRVGKDRIGFEELALAVDTRAIPDGYCLYNPFREGVIESGDDRV
nr:ATP-binding protein [Devosia marina]